MTIPDSLQTLGEHVFWGCSKLVPSNGPLHQHVTPQYNSDEDIDDEYRICIDPSHDPSSEVIAYLPFQQSNPVEKLIAEQAAEILALKLKNAEQVTEIANQATEITALTTEVAALKIANAPAAPTND
ncbi:hypothetical protein TrLO_g11723 [Triparma laevis f. longispina]|uniref:Uncharacterized protein n=1 Tax=Triparma laevis f. longispina TaxID=1714387 RepID=A0A9W6ZIA1_9STRA|nr:hypothetical protein TrLO_g11723 [Triparma laevis f. longispina]